MRILAVDPGEKRIGVAISDPNATIATPLSVITHQSRAQDAGRILQLAVETGVDKIIVGQNLDDEGLPTFSGRKAARLAEELRSQSSLPVELWDESFSTVDARQARLQIGVGRKKRKGHQDDLAAAMILQSYLDRITLDGDQNLKE
ncbi:MAG TPA: Holliday junction resolvase RuvX [Anaerolineaceae bacterium]|nr:Holliday junction resolvase RuvX [Anaerolineaceae bacterium]